ncbi:MAG TPA: WhiB family transcriptional regulator [Acidimicrobiales bacterium]|nr:WhiB family transcriptional regulator [Acidimicrobiales bacterium]
MHDRVWTVHAACRSTDPATFFVARGDLAATTAAKAICRDCPVRVDCLLEGLHNREEFGIWGGAGEPTRRALRRLKADHYRFNPDCDSCFCSAVRDHFARLDGQTCDGPFHTAGPDARHGFASTYSRGCRCDPCRAAKQASMANCRRRPQATSETSQ